MHCLCLCLCQSLLLPALPPPPPLGGTPGKYLKINFSFEVLSVMVPGGCRSQGCLGYLHVHLGLPQFIQAPSPRPSTGDGFNDAFCF